MFCHEARATLNMLVFARLWQYSGAPYTQYFFKNSYNVPHSFLEVMLVWWKPSQKSSAGFERLAYVNTDIPGHALHPKFAEWIPIPNTQTCCSWGLITKSFTWEDHWENHQKDKLSHMGKVSHGQNWGP